MLLHNLEETESFAKQIGGLAEAGDVLVLTGDLGAGKTTLTKGIALGLGIEQMIKSPTYTIIREYTTGRLPLYHMDIYRVAEGAGDLGLEEYFEGEGLSVVEWGNLLQEDLPVDYLELILKKVAGNSEERQLQMVAHGKASEAFLNRINTGGSHD
ncbi:tRNA (adenosine(37)-N6)-threonylcarbamoyltransferase complex ATPase subunit type 1 TsaE [Enterococcus asini]|uniref:tRNA (adenosine(37)-N6)-threonylcarbamoyltransferase complex ATPase subunit type 1 TsaE n=1 Tax=Enterococcus asini TaxID=57732 RepID=UPI00288DCBF6|nr:tRNA (adenosine(37)-N6)-threonylcarbamoyltransferase complex ATPase subunit type 1 TsaE [Enterococcus asini]MDT2756056.1 tRNA (adenosine(37)-N6)-threonylcarbamoyltransferase complex ATPase subunit type 1 TsaE [Enterococcus asini]